MSAAENTKKNHNQQSMQTISIMAPSHYTFSPDRPRHHFELEVTFPHVGNVAPVRFESMHEYLPNVPSRVNPADFYGNIGLNLFMVELHPEPPMDVHVWPEIFVPAGFGRSLKSHAEMLDYNLRSFPRDLNAHSTVLDALAYSVHKTKESADWLFNPLLTLDEALTHLGFRPASESEPKEERRPSRNQYSGVAELLERAWRSGGRNGSGAAMPMGRMTDYVGYYYAQSQLPVCQKVRALLDMPASTIPHYLEY